MEQVKKYNIEGEMMDIPTIGKSKLELCPELDEITYRFGDGVFSTERKWAKDYLKKRKLSLASSSSDEIKKAIYENEVGTRMESLQKIFKNLDDDSMPEFPSSRPSSRPSSPGLLYEKDLLPLKNLSLAYGIQPFGENISEEVIRKVALLYGKKVLPFKLRKLKTWLKKVDAIQKLSGIGWFIKDFEERIPQKELEKFLLDLGITKKKMQKFYRKLLTRDFLKELDILQEGMGGGNLEQRLEKLLFDFNENVGFAPTTYSLIKVGEFSREKIFQDIINKFKISF